MKPKYILSIAVAIFLVGILFFFGKTSTPHKDIDVTQAPSDGHEHIVAANFDSLLTTAKKKLSPKEQAAIAFEENSITRGDLKTQRANSYENLGKLWLKKNRAIAAYYFAESGKLENSEKKLNFAAHLLSEEMIEEMDQSKKQWMLNVAVESYDKSLEINPNNDSIKIDLALLHVNTGSETMKGIQLLLSIVEKDPENIPANVILGKMAIESGQLDKAIERGNKILTFDKNNLEAHLFLAEAYKQNGEKEKAIQLFRKAEKIMDNPDFSKDIDDYIKSFE